MRALPLALVLSGLACASVASAQEARDAEDPQILFDTGLKHMLAGEYQIGCALIKQSLNLDPMPGTIFTLAECYSRAGKTASSVEMYDEFLALYARLPPDERPKQQARAEISKKERARLMATVPWLTVLLPDDAPRGVSVTMDEKRLGSDLIGVAMAVDPGRHRFTTRAPGGRLTEHEVEIAAGQRRTVTLTVHSAAPKDSDSPPYSGVEPADPIDDEEPPIDEVRDGMSPWFYVTGGIGVAGLVTAGVAGVILLQKQKEIFDDCDRDRNGDWTCESQKGIDALQLSQDVLAPVTTVGLAVGAAGIATAAIIWLSGDSPSSQGQNGSVSRRIQIGPGPGNGVSFTGRF